MDQFKLYDINFKKIALTNKVTVKDASGNTVSFAHQKLLKIKEQILFYATEQKEQQIAEVNANKVIDFNVRYTLTDANGQPVYNLVRKGKASLWKANYEVLDTNDTLVATVTEKNPWAKIVDAVVGELPLVGFATGYIFNVKYAVNDPNGTEMLELKKEPSFFEANYSVLSTQQGEVPLPLIQVLTVMLMRERMRS